MRMMYLKETAQKIAFPGKWRNNVYDFSGSLFLSWREMGLDDSAGFHQPPE